VFEIYYFLTRLSLDKPKLTKMATKKSATEAEMLEQYRVALENVTAQPEIASTMQELGYDASTIEVGKNLLSETYNAFDFNRTEHDETNVAYTDYIGKKSKLEEIYSLDRKKGKVTFRNEPLILSKLALTGSTPKSYLKWLEVVKVFYTEAVKDVEIQNKLLRLKITSEQVTSTLNLISEMETARSYFLKEKSEDQTATMAKDKAFAKIDDWMSEFFAVAKIGLEDKPQLLEALGKSIRN